MSLPCQKTFALGSCRLQVWCVEAAAVVPHEVLPCAHAELVLRQLVHQPRGADGLMLLLWSAWPALRGPRLAPARLDALLLRLSRTGQLRVQWAAARGVTGGDTQMLPTTKLTFGHKAQQDDQEPLERLSMCTTVLILRVGVDQKKWALPVEMSSRLQSDASNAHVRPDSLGFVDVPDALDDGRACWQLRQLREAALQGTLETWGVPTGDGVKSAGGF